MKKNLILSLACAILVLASAFALSSCGQKAEIAVVTDVGLLMDGGFNQGTWEGAESYAKANGKTVKYYQPANAADATDADRITAMQTAIKNGAKVIVTPGFLQAAAIQTVAKENPKVKFVFVDGWNFGPEYKNVTAIAYKEEESGFFAGYAAVKDGYTKLGGTFGGGGTNPACNRFAYGYVQGANAAAAEMGKTVDIKISFKYGSTFGASPELATQMAGWYGSGTEIVFACGGSMVQSVKSAAEATDNGKIIGVDVDQASLSPRVLTSAVKGLAVSVQQVLGQFYAGEWDDKLADKTQNLGAKEDATGIPTASESWRFATFTVEEYQALFAKVKNGTLTIKNDIAENCDNEAFWAAVNTASANANVSLDK
jgi:basic membrane protein A